MILVDANIFMYAAGAEHPHKEPSREFLEQVARGEVEAVVDAEALQEILHRYRASGHWSEGSRIYDLARRIMPLVLPITAEVLDKSHALLDRYAALTARDALHAAVVQNHGLRAICSYDKDFDEIEGLERIQPGSARPKTM
jgi:predicted nucleic acid-binding protein